MSDSLASLAIKVLGDIADFRTSMQQTRDIAKDVAESVKGQFDKVNAAVKAAVVGLVAFGSVGALKNTFNEIVSTTAALKDMSERTGISVEKWSALGAVAKAGGHDVGILEGAVTKLAKGLVNADEETKGAGRALEFLGIKARDSSGKMRDGGDLIKDIADKLKTYSDGLGKTAIVQDLFGKSGAASLPILKDLAEAGELVSKVTTEQAHQADEYERTIKALTKSKEALKKEIAFGVMPVVKAFADTMLDLQKQNNGVNDSVKKLRQEGTIEEWARDGARAIAFLIDAARAVPVVFKSAGAYLAGLGFDMAAVADIAAGAFAVFSAGGNLAQMQEGTEKINDAWKRVGQGALMARSDMEDFAAVFTKGSFREALDKQFGLADLEKAVGAADSKTRHATNGLDGYRAAATETAKAVHDTASIVAKAWVDLNLDATKSAFKIDEANIQFAIDSLNRIRSATGDSIGAIEQFGVLSAQKFDLMARSIDAERKVITDAMDAIMGKIASAKDDGERNKAIANYLADAKKLIPLQERTNALDVDRKKNAEEVSLALQKLNAEQGKEIAALSAGLDKEKAHNEALKLSTQEIGLNTRELLDLNIARLDAKIALAEIVAGTEMANEVDLRQLDILREQRKVLADRAPLEAAKQAAEESHAMFKDMQSSMEGFFTDLVLHGRSAFDGLWQNIKGFFAKLAAQFATKFVLNIAASALGLGDAGGISGLLSQLLGAAGGSPGGSSGGSLIGAILGAGGLGGLGSLGGLMGLGSGTGLLGALGAGANLSLTGLLGGGLSGLGSGIGMSFSAGLLPGLGSLLPILGPIAAIAGIVSLFAKDEKGFKIDNSVVGVGNPASHFTASALGNFDYSGDVNPKDFAPFTARVNKIDSIIAHDLFSDETLAIVRDRIQAVKNPGWWNLDDKDAVNKASLYFLKERYGIAFDAINKTIADAIRNFGGTADELLNYLDAVTAIDWNSVSGNLAGAVAALASTTDGVQQAIALMKSASFLSDLIGTDFVQLGADIFAAQNATALDAYRIQGDAFDKLIDAAMAGQAGFADLTQGAEDFANAAAKAFADIVAARANVASTVDGAVRDFRLSGMTNDEKINFFRNETEALRAQMAVATDPREIERLISQIVQNSQAAYALLSPEQQNLARDDYIQGLLMARNEAEANLARVEATLTATTSATLADAKIALDAILAALAKNNDADAAANDKFDDAVDKFGRIIGTPFRIIIEPPNNELVGGR